MGIPRYNDPMIRVMNTLAFPDTPVFNYDSAINDQRGGHLNLEDYFFEPGCDFVHKIQFKVFL